MSNKFVYHPEAIDLIQNEKVIRLKNELIQQLELQLQRLGNQTALQYPQLAELSPPPKVSKGEKHQGLPFVVLDFPRNFSRKDIFAIRTTVWWGKHISISLLLRGNFLDVHFSMLQQKVKNDFMNGLYLSTSGNIWSNELKQKVIASTHLSENIEFFKLSFKFPLNQLNEMENIYFNSVNQLLSVLDYAKS